MQKHLDTLTAAGFAQVADALAGLSRDSIRIVTTPAEENAFSLGQSKIGGAAHVPADFAWPEFQGVPLFFIAQIDLAELPPSPAASFLPEKGLLSFFFEGGMEAWGYDPADKGAARVYWFDCEPSLLVSVKREDKEDENMSSPSPCTLAFSPDADISVNSEQVDMDVLRSGMPQKDRKAVDALLDAISDEIYEERSGVINKLFGWPDLVQGDIFTEAQLVTNGLYCGDSTGYRDPRAESLTAQRHDWQLLLQVDSDDNADMMWGDAGRVYFLIKLDDLRERRFDQAWFAFQCG